MPCSSRRYRVNLERSRSGTGAVEPPLLCQVVRRISRIIASDSHAPLFILLAAFRLRSRGNSRFAGKFRLYTRTATGITIRHCPRLGELPTIRKPWLDFFLSDRDVCRGSAISTAIVAKPHFHLFCVHVRLSTLNFWASHHGCDNTLRFRLVTCVSFWMGRISLLRRYFRFHAFRPLEWALDLPGASQRAPCDAQIPFPVIPHQTKNISHRWASHWFTCILPCVIRPAVLTGDISYRAATFITHLCRILTVLDLSGTNVASGS